jgi:hypothetical protein
LRSAVSLWTQILPPEHYRLHRTTAMLGTALLAQRRYREAESTLVAAHARMQAAPAAREADKTAVARQLAALYDSLGQTATADSLRNAAVSAP